jgi:hypothetical protein
MGMSNRPMWDGEELPPARVSAAGEAWQDWAKIGVITEEKPDKRPSCGYRERAQPDQPKKACGSEDRLFNVTGAGTWGKAKTTPVCPKHIEKAWKEWNVDSAAPIGDLPTGKV